MATRKANDKGAGKSASSRRGRPPKLPTPESGALIRQFDLSQPHRGDKILLERAVKRANEFEHIDLPLLAATLNRYFLREGLRKAQSTEGATRAIEALRRLIELAMLSPGGSGAAASKVRDCIASLPDLARAMLDHSLHSRGAKLCSWYVIAELDPVELVTLGEAIKAVRIPVGESGSPSAASRDELFADVCALYRESMQSPTVDDEADDYESEDVDAKPVAPRERMVHRNAARLLECLGISTPSDPYRATKRGP